MEAFFLHGVRWRVFSLSWEILCVISLLFILVARQKLCRLSKNPCQVNLSYNPIPAQSTGALPPPNSIHCRYYTLHCDFASIYFTGDPGGTASLHQTDKEIEDLLSGCVQLEQGASQKGLEVTKSSINRWGILPPLGSEDIFCLSIYLELPRQEDEKWEEEWMVASAKWKKYRVPERACHTCQPLGSQTWLCSVLSYLDEHHWVGVWMFVYMYVHFTTHRK